MTRKQWTNILRMVDGQKLQLMQVSATEKTLLGFPVRLSAQASTATASAVSGPIFGDLESAFTLRIVDDSLMLMRSSRSTLNSFRPITARR
jgi:HK97 family phage major capsid protein